MDDHEFVQLPDGQTMILEDKVASRVIAYTNLLLELRNVKDEKIIEEGLLMLARLRLSINIVPETPVSIMKGGKKD
jgi:hypothetical protein